MLEVQVRPPVMPSTFFCAWTATTRRGAACDALPMDATRRECSEAMMLKNACNRQCSPERVPMRKCGHSFELASCELIAVLDRLSTKLQLHAWLLQAKQGYVRYYETMLVRLRVAVYPVRSKGTACPCPTTNRLCPDNLRLPSYTYATSMPPAS